MTAITCKFCNTIFQSVLIPKDEAMSEAMMALGSHINLKHPNEYKDAIQKYMIMVQLMQAYLVPNLTGMVGPSLSVDGENPIETRLKELHRLILEGIDPPAIDTQTSTLII